MTYTLFVMSQFFRKLVKPYNLFLTDKVLVFISIFLLKKSYNIFWSCFSLPQFSPVPSYPSPAQLYALSLLKTSKQKNKNKQEIPLPDTCKHTCQNENKQAKDQEGKN